MSMAGAMIGHNGALIKETPDRYLCDRLQVLQVHHVREELGRVTINGQVPAIVIEVMEKMHVGAMLVDPRLPLSQALRDDVRAVSCSPPACGSRRVSDGRGMPHASYVMSNIDARQRTSRSRRPGLDSSGGSSTSFCTVSASVSSFSTTGRSVEDRRLSLCNEMSSFAPRSIHVRLSPSKNSVRRDCLTLLGRVNQSLPAPSGLKP